MRTTTTELIALIVLAIWIAGAVYAFIAELLRDTRFDPRRKREDCTPVPSAPPKPCNCGAEAVEGPTT